MTVAMPAIRRRIVLSDLLPGQLVRDVALVAGGAALVGAAAQVSFHIPGTPVPITGQTWAVLVAGAALGARRAAASMALYLVAGLVGVPWFAGHTHGAGGAALGYILGFVVAAAAVGALARRGGDRTVARTVGSYALGTGIIYIVGVAYLMADLHLGLRTGLDLGLWPFLIGDAIKAIVAGGVLPTAWRMVDRSSR